MAAFDMMQLEAFFCSAQFTSNIGDFMARRGPDLEFKPLEEEQPLRNHDIYKEYTHLVERQLQSFITEQGVSPQAVYEACAKAQADAQGSSWMTCLDYLVACTEYEEFMQLAFDHCSVSTYEPSEGAASDPEAANGDDGAPAAAPQGGA